MVFRASGQLYALPMQFIQNAGANNQHLPAVRLEELMMRDTSFVDATANAGQRLVLACHQLGQEPSEQVGRRITLVVDEIVGPEEVVVRPLPSLLKQHPVCCGATLSGLGETVLVLDTLHVLESAEDCVAKRNAKLPLSCGTPSAAARSPRPKVLVVDDSKSARTRVVRSLSRYDVDTVEACDGQEALELMTSQHFSAVFSDMEMPHVDGMELLSTIRRTEQEQAPPVVIISSRGESSFRDSATQLGAADYLIKPLADEELDQSIQAISSLSSLIRVTSPA